MAYFKADDPDGQAKMMAMFSPGQIDQTVRHAIGMCYMRLPPEKKSIAEVESQFRRIVERALKDLKEDAEAFGIPRP